MDRETESSVMVREDNIKKLWFWSDKWFRILEFSLLLGLLNVFKEKTNSVLIGGIYWMSWAIFYLLFLGIGEYISENINSKNKIIGKRRFFVWSVTLFFTLLFYIIITAAASTIESVK